MKSYPASCNFLVAQPPSYNESMENITRTQNNTKVKTEIKYVYVYPKRQTNRRHFCVIL